MRHHGALAAVVAFGIGYAFDAFAGSQLGVHTLLAVVVFVGTYYISSRLMTTNVMVGVVAVFFGVILDRYGTIALEPGSASHAFHSVTWSLVIPAAVSAIIAPIIFAFLAGAKRLIGLPDKPERE
jgi:rod shape-determining protein MreD